jgi:hypothetical protein
MKVKPQSPGNRGTAGTSTRPQGNQLGGGIGSRVVRKEGTRDGQKAFGINPGAASQIGEALGNHSTEQGRNLSYKGEQWREKTPISVPLGNELAKNVGKGGVGTGRTLYGQCGSQGTYGSPNPGATRPGAEKPILNFYGPDSSAVRGRK